MNGHQNARARKRSLLSRLLWPINIISFICLTAIAALMVMDSKKSLEAAMHSKVTSLAEFLQQIGTVYVTNYDLSALGKFAEITSKDSDIAYAIYLDQAGKSMTEAQKRVEGANIREIELSIPSHTGQAIGRVQLGYKTDRIQEGFWRMVTLCAVAAILAQLMLSFAVFYIVRGIVSPILSTLGRMRSSTATLAETSNEITRFSETLSSGVNQQGEVVQETTAAMAEMSSMLNQTSGYASQSDQVMNSVRQKADNGMSVMNQMVDAMSSIGQANEQLKQMVDMIQEISNKTKVINDIVFKTQLLSFNASIEAARAGQHGRGFAVVAEEVGNLAKMSGAAATEIGSLLQDSEKTVNEIVRNTQERVTGGRQVTESALKNFREIASDIEMMASQIGNISSAAREQEMGVAQTSQAMAELAKTTETNNSVANQAQTSAKTLRLEIESMNSIARLIANEISGAEIQQAVQASPLRDRNANTPQASSGAEGTWSESQADLSSLSHRIVDLAIKQNRVGEADSAPPRKAGNE